MRASANDISLVFIELGAAVVGLATLSRLASRLSFSAIPLYIIAGLAFGNGGLLPFSLSEGFIHIGGEIGVVLLLFMLGLEYSSEELTKNLRIGLPAGVLDFALNFTPGFIAGWLLGWHVLSSVLLGGVTWISSCGTRCRISAAAASISGSGSVSRRRGAFWSCRQAIRAAYWTASRFVRGDILFLLWAAN